MHKIPRQPLIILIGIFASLNLTAQISGKVVNEQSQPMPFCQVALAKSNDTSMVAMAATDIDGKFEIKDKYVGTFILLASSMGYDKYYSAPFTLTNENSKYDAGIITLKGGAQFLKSVNVVAQKPFVEYKEDRTVYNIENSVISAGNNVLEVLKKLPGVKADNGDNLAVNGQSGVLILIDGRTMYLTGTDLANYLKSLNANQVEKIEVLSHPSAKYDAAGSTVINIVLKKDKKGGFNAELTSRYSQGIYYGIFEGANLNYSSAKWNIFGTYGYGIDNTFQRIGMDTKFLNNEVVQTTINDSLQKKSIGDHNNGTLSVDFTPDKKQTIGFVADISQSGEALDKNYTTNVYGSNSRLDSSTNLMGHRTYNVMNMAFDLNYTLKIDSTGRELSAAFDYAAYSTTFNELDVNSIYDTLNQLRGTPVNLKFSLPNNVNIWAARIDYTQPLGKDCKLETGLKSSYVTTGNNAQYWNVVNGVDVVDTGFTNNFNYSEYIYAGYISIESKLGKKTDFQLGLRGEETQGKGVQLVHDTSFTHNYFNLFPNGRITYRLDTNNLLHLSYRRRIWRPDYQSLNPFIFIISTYTYDKGNPALLPQISNAFYIGDAYKHFLSVDIGDEYWTNPINNVTTTNNTTHIIYTTPFNFTSYNNFYGKVDATVPFAKWFTSMNSFLLMQQQSQGMAEGSPFSVSQLVYTFSTVNTFTIGKSWSSEVDFNYSSKSLNGLFIVQPVYTLYAGIKKTFAKERGTASLNFSDIFWSDRFSGAENIVNTYFSTSSYNDTRFVALSLSWKFGKAQHERQEKEKAAEEEMNRVR
jgi:iron complex outermembrane receptor protein